MLRCIESKYDRLGGVYEDAAEFLEMCEDVFECAPVLREAGGCWFEGDTLILVPDEGEPDSPEDEAYARAEMRAQDWQKL